MAADVDDVVDAAHDPEVAVLVATRAVPGEVEPGEALPVALFEALRILEDRAQHRRPRPLQHQETAFVRLHRLAGGVDDVGFHAEERQRAGAGLRRRRAGKRRDHDAAGLRLPPGVDDRAALLADHAVVPHPRFGVDRLADRAEQAQRGQIEAIRMLVAPPHERPQCGRRGVEDRDAVALDDLPEPSRVRNVRRAFVHDDRRAVQQRAVDDVRMARHPAHVRGAPVDVVVLQIEHHLRGQIRADHVAAGRVHDALRLPGGPGRVQDEQQRFGIERRRVVPRRLLRDQVVPPVIAARAP
jgi:hypothetical protein